MKRQRGETEREKERKDCFSLNVEKQAKKSTVLFEDEIQIKKVRQKKAEMRALEMTEWF